MAASSAFYAWKDAVPATRASWCAASRRRRSWPSSARAVASRHPYSPRSTTSTADLTDSSSQAPSVCKKALRPKAEIASSWPGRRWPTSASGHSERDITYLNHFWLDEGYAVVAPSGYQRLGLAWRPSLSDNAAGGLWSSSTASSTVEGGDFGLSQKLVDHGSVARRPARPSRPLSSPRATRPSSTTSSAARSRRGRTNVLPPASAADAEANAEAADKVKIRPSAICC